jgi:hypothetical protein
MVDATGSMAGSRRCRGQLWEFALSSIRQQDASHNMQVDGLSLAFFGNASAHDSRSGDVHLSRAFDKEI